MDNEKGQPITGKAPIFAGALDVGKSYKLKYKKSKQPTMISCKYQFLECECVRLGNLRQNSHSTKVRKSGPIWLIVASMLGVLVWLVFILIYALYWSGDFSLFQNVVVFIVSLGITGVLIGLMWVILGPEKYRTWNQ